MQTREMLNAAITAVTLWIAASACGAGPATCAGDEECPGRLVCDEPSGLCALERTSDTDEPPAEPSGQEGNDQGAPAPADSTADAAAPSPDAPDANDEGDGAGVEDGDTAQGSDEVEEEQALEDGDDAAGQCIEEGDACEYTQLGARDGCCESFHCCPVFHICVPNFWEE